MIFRKSSADVEIFFFSSVFSGKNDSSADVKTFFLCSSMLCGGNLYLHFPKRGDCVKKVEDPCFIVTGLC